MHLVYTDMKWVWVAILDHCLLGVWLGRSFLKSLTMELMMERSSLMSPTWLGLGMYWMGKGRRFSA